MSGFDTAMLVAGSGLYGLGGALSLRDRPGAVGLAVLAGVLVFGLLIAVRWQETGQGPFLTMYEILLSSLFSLGFVYGLACRFDRRVCAGAPAAILVLLMFCAWILMVERDHVPLPATYGNPWLWVHVFFGKVFLGCSLVAASLATVLLARKASASGSGAAGLDDLAWRWLMAALVFHSGMLVAGAVWAQDAWGRYWDWDPLETWAFATWLMMALSVHARRTLNIGPTAGRWLLVGVFVLAVLTFFGVPFVSIAPHKGAV